MKRRVICLCLEEPEENKEGIIYAKFSHVYHDASYLEPREVYSIRGVVRVDASSLDDFVYPAFEEGNIRLNTLKGKSASNYQWHSESKNNRIKPVSFYMDHLVFLSELILDNRAIVNYNQLILEGAVADGVVENVINAVNHLHE